MVYQGISASCFEGRISNVILNGFCCHIWFSIWAWQNIKKHMRFCSCSLPSNIFCKYKHIYLYKYILNIVSSAVQFSAAHHSLCGSYVVWFIWFPNTHWTWLTVYRAQCSKDPCWELLVDTNGFYFLHLGQTGVNAVVVQKPQLQIPSVVPMVLKGLKVERIAKDP